MQSSQVRQTFLSYFRRQGHEIVPSSSLIPENDATLLFANAGMNQFKNVFLGFEQRPYKRAASSQKCVRAGGKHNDLDNVGFTARHHTFFEMLGNFSFGDYFKKDAIHFAWELLTKDFAIPKDKLYVTVFESDDEAADIWHKQEGVPRDRIFRFGEKDNFWRMGDVGPCGPCSEIFYDHGAKGGRESDPFKGIAAGEDRFVEIWNLVFMQFDEKSPGQMVPLPAPSVDTGSGLERVTAALQGKLNNYDTDLFWPMIVKASELSQKTEILQSIEQLARDGVSNQVPEAQQKQVAALRVIADHTRTISLLLADGALPSNEGRGYVLRRILRRAARFSQMLSGEGAFLPEVAEVFIQNMGSVFPELKARRDHVLATIRQEQNRFLETLSTGLEMLDRALSQCKGKVLPGSVAFKLYDTSGFPLDLTQLVAAEKGYQVDVAGFESEMEKARARSQESWKGKAISGHQAHLIASTQKLAKPTEFLGYQSLSATSPVVLLSNGEKEVNELEGQGYLVSEKTPFYAEGGGQVGDQGSLTQGNASARVLDVQKVGSHFVHTIETVNGKIQKTQAVNLSVDVERRRRTASNHSATHLLHAALRKVLGPSVTQAGSLVDAQKLRFDFTWNKPVSSQQIQQIESLVNQEIAQAVPVEVSHSSYKQAIEMGALALFGEKYGDQVRVLRMGVFSTELCGGTHVTNTAQIRVLKIVSESGVSSGVRRIEALTSDGALQWLQKHAAQNAQAREALGVQEGWEQFLSSAQTPSEKIEQLQLQLREAEKEIKKLKLQAVSGGGGSQSALVEKFSAGHLVVSSIASADRDILAQTADRLRDQHQPAVVALLGLSEGATPLILSVSHAISEKFPAGGLFKMLTEKHGGKGGGKPTFAQGTLSSNTGPEELLKTLKQVVLEKSR